MSYDFVTYTLLLPIYLDILIYLFVHSFLRELFLGLLGDVVQVSTQQLDALNVVALVKLLVDGVSAVC